MADKLTDEELIAALKEYGEKIKVPIDRKRRPILIKKLNHLRANDNKNSKSKRRSGIRKKQPVEFSSEEDESDVDLAPPTPPRQVSGRRSVRNNRSTEYSNTNTIEISPSNSRTDRSSSRLYPDLSTIEDRLQPDASRTFDSEEFSDSDADASIYEVTNKSVNTTFSLYNNEMNANDGSDDHADDKCNNSQLTTYSGSNRGHARKREIHSKNHISSNSFTEEEIRQQGFQTCDDTHKGKQPAASYISTVIVVAAVIFFLLLGLIYLYLCKDIIYVFISDSFSSGTNIKSPPDLFCEGSALSASQTNDCIHPDKLEQCLDIVNTWEGNLLAKAAGTKNIKPKLSQSDFEKGLDNEKKELTSAALALLLYNPNWNIRAFDNSGSQIMSYQKASEVKYLETDPLPSLIERVWKALYKIFVGFVLLLTVFVSFLFLLYLWRRYLHIKEEEKSQVFDMVGKIIDSVKDNFELHQKDNSYPPYIAIQHVRDQLLPPSQRKHLLPLWKKAVDFLESNESRIRVETQTIQGEDFLVWRWLPISSNGSKVWMGQAFGENNVSSGNTLHYGPTPCLKIRNMFDSDMETEEDWELNVQDAILEKCRGITGILHIHVDRGSREGCVYVKCNSCDIAYQVYRSLHGWWFDGRLVTVKYLRLEQYHEKFPPAKKATKSLRPSNNRMASLSQPFHCSTLEMT